MTAALAMLSRDNRTPAPAIMPSNADSRLGQVQSVVRALAILEEIASAEGLKLSEIADRVDLPRSTAHRLLVTMQSLKFARFDRQTSGWSLGTKALAVGRAFEQDMP